VDFDSDARTMGFNVGAGGDFFFNRNMALTTMVKYYHSQKEQTRINPGGEYYELSNMSFEIDPSFWLVTCGVKFISRSLSGNPEKREKPSALYPQSRRTVSRRLSRGDGARNSQFKVW